MKQVANKDAILRINKDATWIEESDLSHEVNESDGYALEEALRLKEKGGSGEVVVVSMGPQRVKAVIKDALARGADRAIHILRDDLSQLTPFAAASTIAEAVRNENADLILTGLQSDDHGFAQTGVILAELMNLPHATIVIEVDASGENLRVKRELESGWYQWYSMPKPALLTIQSGISQIRYATLKGIMAAKKKPVETLTLADLGIDPGDVGTAAAWTEVDDIQCRPPRSAGTIVSADEGSGAQKLVEFLASQKFI